MISIAKQLIRIAKEIISQRCYIDRTTDFFKSLTKHKVIQGKQVYKTEDGYFYVFDEMHGHWQQYNKRGKHLGVADQNGNLIEDAIVGRSINLK